MMGIKIWVFEAAESISRLIFISSVIIFDLEGPRPLFCPWAWEFFTILLIVSYIVEMGIKIWVFEVAE